MARINKRHYTNEERKKAVEMCMEHSITEVERRTGITRPTLRSWCKEEGVTPYRKRAELDEQTVFKRVRRSLALTALNESRNIPKVATAYGVSPKQVLQWYKKAKQTTPVS